MFGLLAIVTVVSAASGLASQGSKIENSYIVKVKETSRISFQAHLAEVRRLFNTRSEGQGIQSVFSNLGNLYAIRGTKATVEKIEDMHEVEYVEQDQVVKLAKVQHNATWGLARISHRTKFDGDYDYVYTSDGEGVSVYVIDTGIMVNHPEFEGRASIGASFAGYNDDDEHGHGTHCAGTVGSKSYGVAKKANLVSVKVFDGSGSGSTSGILSAIDWAIGDKKGVRGNAFNNAVDATVNRGFSVVVAAGNYNRDACDFSPASAPSVITVAASDINDARATFSNYGECIDVFAPGVDIKSTWNNGDTYTMSGTSMATPHVAGMVANLLSKSPASQSQIKAKIITMATKYVLSNVGHGSPNLMAFIN
ncbi:hypothetical protein L0F63_002749 [Massospora cicadina]|nr:hypothetical protein L0F63_002749 [Massospora cicadina]